MSLTFGGSCGLQRSWVKKATWVVRGRHISGVAFVVEDFAQDNLHCTNRDEAELPLHSTLTPQHCPCRPAGCDRSWPTDRKPENPNTDTHTHTQRSTHTHTSFQGSFLKAQTTVQRHRVAVAALPSSRVIAGRTTADSTPLCTCLPGVRSAPARVDYRIVHACSHVVPVSSGPDKAPFKALERCSAGKSSPEARTSLGMETAARDQASKQDCSWRQALRLQTKADSVGPIPSS